MSYLWQIVDALTNNQSEITIQDGSTIPLTKLIEIELSSMIQNNDERFYETFTILSKLLPTTLDLIKLAKRLNHEKEYNFMLAIKSRRDIQVFKSWYGQNINKTKWLVLCHGKAYRSALEYLPENLQNNATLFTVDIRPDANPDIVMNIENGLTIFPDESFDGVLFAYCPMDLTLPIYNQLKRIVKDKGYWVSAASYRDSKGRDTIEQLIDSSESRQFPVDDHFTVPYEFKYKVPVEYKEKFLEFRNEAVQMRRNFDRAKRGAGPRVRSMFDEFKQNRLKLFWQMFGMSPEQFGSLH